MTDTHDNLISSIRVITRRVSRDHIKHIARETFETMAKAVVDIEKRIMAVGGELHADANAVLLEQGSRQSDVWGINLYPDKHGDEWIEFISLINIRPAVGNRSMEVKDPTIRKRIAEIVNQLIE